MIFTTLDDVRTGMALGVGLENSQGHTLLGPGVALTARHIERLRGLGCPAVWVDDEDTRDIEYDHLLSEGTRQAASREVRNMFAIAGRQAPSLQSASIEAIRDALSTRRFQRGYESEDAAQRLLVQAERMVRETLDRSLLTGSQSVRTTESDIFHHCVDVAATAVVLGRLAGHNTPALRTLAVGSMLHDIGKVFFDEAILPSGTMTREAEERALREHAALGYLLLRDGFRVGVLAAHIAYQHHERQDGGGYPRGLVGTNRVLHGLETHTPGQITPLAEITAIADCYDACTSDRINRPAMPPDRVWQLIRDGAGTQFNREAVDLFLAALPPFPLGTRVVVTTGRWRGASGVIARIDGRAITQPVVRLLADASGQRMNPVEIDLRKDGDVSITSARGAREVPAEAGIRA